MKRLASSVRSSIFNRFTSQSSSSSSQQESSSIQVRSSDASGSLKRKRLDIGEHEVKLDTSTFSIDPTSIYSIVSKKGQNSVRSANLHTDKWAIVIQLKNGKISLPFRTDLYPFAAHRRASNYEFQSSSFSGYTVPPKVDEKMKQVEYICCDKIFVSNLSAVEPPSFPSITNPIHSIISQCVKIVYPQSTVTQSILTTHHEVYAFHADTSNPTKNDMLVALLIQLLPGKFVSYTPSVNDSSKIKVQIKDMVDKRAERCFSSDMGMIFTKMIWNEENESDYMKLLLDENSAVSYYQVKVKNINVLNYRHMATILSLWGCKTSHFTFTPEDEGTLSFRFYHNCPSPLTWWVDNKPFSVK